MSVPEDTPGLRLRRALASPEATWIPSVYDCMSAKVLEAAGFGALCVSSSGVALAGHGLPVALLSSSEMVASAQAISASVDVPVIVDADIEYGNAVHLRRFVERIFDTRAAGLYATDRDVPARTPDAVGRLLALPVAAAALRFAGVAEARAARHPDRVVIAHSVITGPVEAVVDACRAYLDAGVDFVFPDGIHSEHELATLAEAVDGRVLYHMYGVSPMLSADRLTELGVAGVVRGLPLRATLRALWDYAADLHAGGTEAEIAFEAAGASHPLGDIPAFKAFAGYAELEEWEREHLAPG